MNPLSVSLLMIRARCSIPICVNIFRIEGRPRPASFIGICTPSLEKLGRRPRACLIALLRMPSMVVSCLLLNTPRCVARYLDFSSCSAEYVLRDELSLRFAMAFAIFLTCLVMWRKCSQKSSMGFMWTPSILYDLLGGRYLM